MANDGKIKIIITTGDVGGKPGEPGTGDSNKEKEKDKKENSLGSYIEHQFYNLIKEQAMNNINFAVNNIGNFTGDYQTQRTTSASISFVKKFINLGTAFAAGTKATGSPIGGVIAASVAAVGDMISLQQLWFTNQVEQKKANYEIAQIRNRSGLNSLTDGSRGTQN